MQTPEVFAQPTSQAASQEVLQTVSPTISDRDPLWEKAVLVAESNMDWIPGMATMSIRELTLNGKVKNEVRIWIRLRPGDSGQVTSEISQYIENGKDITTEKKQSSQQGDGEGNSQWLQAMEDNPFLPSQQQGVSASRSGEWDSINGYKCIPFIFTWQNKAGDFHAGRAWLDEHTGAPVRVVMSPETLPMFVDSMITTVDYEYIERSAWFPTRMSIEGSGGILIFKRAFQMQMNFEEHWRQTTD